MSTNKRARELKLKARFEGDSFSGYDVVSGSITLDDPDEIYHVREVLSEPETPEEIEKAIQKVIENKINNVSGGVFARDPLNMLIARTFSDGVKFAGPLYAKAAQKEMALKCLEILRMEANNLFFEDSGFGNFFIEFIEQNYVKEVK